eukprot:6445831-Amphidinium_carterae.1
MDPVMFAFAVAIFSWVDTSLPQCLLAGFPIVGDMEPSRVHRPVQPKDSLSRDQLLGISAVRFVNQLEANLRVHPHAAIIADETEKEVQLGLASPARSRHQIDSKYGKGGWRPIPRHV